MSRPHVFEADFFIGQTVMFVLDSGTVGLVTGIQIRQGGTSYLVTWENRQETTHFAFELTASERAIVR